MKAAGGCSALLVQASGPRRVLEALLDLIIAFAGVTSYSLWIKYSQL